MLKLLGAVMVMTGAFALGFQARRSLADRVSELELLLWETGRLRARIGGCGLSLEDCFAESGLFAPAAEGLRAGLTPGEAVLSCGIKAEGLSLFAQGLEAETVEGQLQNIDVFSRRLEVELAAAREDLAKKGRLYMGLGALGGAAVCVILV